MQMFGRTVIYTDASSVTAENVREVLKKALIVHTQNQNEILYPIIFKYLYTVGLLSPHTRANSLMFILPAT